MAKYQRAWRAANPGKAASYTARWRAANPDKVATQNKVKRGGVVDRERNVRQRYGLTPREYYALLGEQNGLCAICGMVNDGYALAVDHEHVDGYEKLSAADKARLVRGLICHPCNTFIGFCKEDPAAISRKATALANAGSYLQRNRSDGASHPPHDRRSSHAVAVH